MKAISLSLLIFGVAGFAGPLLRWASWPPASTRDGILGNFVYDFVLLIWPMQPFATIEANVGSLFAIGSAVIANVAFFLVIGVIAAVMGKNVSRLVITYLGTVILVASVAIWAFGLRFSPSDVVTFLLALVFYAIPFVVFGAFAMRDEQQWRRMA